ncbi:hypothetical protein DNH61_01090 [Paenibacillus sambharensis]|uniref:Uncharacterized protein n=1 Tax=Paenibacillus sambharensis TaxID=1803190 RepID=A0A2W1LRB7_9BACL|nr:hypothetical protein [Paenibacillus sambharensis]PZD97502.1 hypothetical protein DNH61_01090 [Paenibacillus sambharensis]
MEIIGLIITAVCALVIVSLIIILLGYWDQHHTQNKLIEMGAIASCGAYHVGGVPGVPAPAKVKLYIGADRLMIKYKRQTHVIPVNSITAAKDLARSKEKLDYMREHGLLYPDSPDGLLLGPMMELMDPEEGPRIFKRISSYLLLNYLVNNQLKAMAFGFDQVEDYRPFDEFYPRLLGRMESSKIYG